MVLQNEAPTPEANKPSDGQLEGAAPEAASEAPPEPEKPAEPEPPKHDHRAFAALARRERAIVERERAIKAEANELNEYRQAKENARRNPTAFLQSIGLDINDLADLIINNGEPTESHSVKTLQAEIDELRQELKTRDEKAAERENEAQMAQIMTGIKQKLAGNSDFELINANNAYEHVYNAWVEYYNETGDDSKTVEDAAREVEAYYESELEKLVGIQKLRSKFGNLQPEKSGNEPIETAPTLTSQHTAATMPEHSGRYLSEDDSKARMIERLRELNLRNMN